MDLAESMGHLAEHQHIRLEELHRSHQELWPELVVEVAAAAVGVLEEEYPHREAGQDLEDHMAFQHPPDQELG